MLTLLIGEAEQRGRVASVTGSDSGGASRVDTAAIEQEVFRREWPWRR